MLPDAPQRRVTHDPCAPLARRDAPHSADFAAAAATDRWRAGQALSAIDGVPFVVKDPIETADLPTQMNIPV